MSWKKTRQVSQTADEPPRMGRSCLAAMGSTRKRRKAESKTAVAYSARDEDMSGQGKHNRREEE